MNLKTLSDQALLESTERLVKRENELLSEILHHLREIERRRLFSQLGFKSLFDYATKKLGYADDQAFRRISAMRLLKELPELEEKIVSGSLTLTNLSMAQTLFRQEQKKGDGSSKEQKLSLLSQLENKSKREAEKIIVARSPLLLKPDQVRAVSETTIEIKFMAQAHLQSKIEKVKGLLAHSHPNMAMAEVIDLLCDMAIQKLDPTEKTAPVVKRRGGKAVRLQVWQKAQSRCQNCGGTYALEVDHIRPKSLGGTDEPENLRLLCRTCNQRAAINQLGLRKMQPYIDPLSIV